MSSCFFFNGTASAEVYTLSLHDALPILNRGAGNAAVIDVADDGNMQAFQYLLMPQNGICIEQRLRRMLVHAISRVRSEEHTSELQSRRDLVCRLLLEKKNMPFYPPHTIA